MSVQVIRAAKQITVLAGNAFPQGRVNRLRHRNGADVYTMFYTTRLIDGSGQHIGWMSSVVDITAQKRAEEMQQQRELGDAPVRNQRCAVRGVLGIQHAEFKWRRVFIKRNKHFL